MQKSSPDSRWGDYADEPAEEQSSPASVRNNNSKKNTRYTRKPLHT